MKPFLQRMMAASTLLRTYTGFARPSLFQYSRTFSSAFQLRKYIDPPVNTDKQQPFEFIAHAAWYPKQKTRDMPSWKHKDAGEDAFFQTKTSQGLALGVADGVGGWSSVGVDPGMHRHIKYYYYLIYYFIQHSFHGL